jgi:hypothetical protein
MVLSRKPQLMLDRRRQMHVSHKKSPYNASIAYLFPQTLFTF